MVTYTSLTPTDTRSARTEPADTSVARSGRYRPVLSFSPPPAARLVHVETRCTGPVFGSVKGEVCPLTVDAKSPMRWQLTTTMNNSIVFGGFGFDHLTDDIDTRVGPPPPSRSSV